MMMEDEEDIEQVEYQRYGFASKVTEMSEGKANLQKRKQKKLKYNKLMRPSKKPSIAKYVPRPVDVSAEHARRGGLIGIPEGVDGLRPIRFFKSDNTPHEKDLLFGNVKRDSKGRRRLF
jgi:hypothetical protein